MAGRLSGRYAVLTARLCVSLLAWLLWPNESSAPTNPASSTPSASHLADEPGPLPGGSEPERAALPAADVEVEPQLDADTISGIVRDEDGNPIPTATVRIYERGQLDAICEADVESDGRFTIKRDSSWGAKLSAKADAPGFSNGRTRQPVSGFVEITLLFATHVYGRVLDAETGAPITGASVSYWAEEVTSQTDGSYRIGRIPIPYGATLAVRKTGYATLHQGVMPRERKPVALDLHLHRGNTVSVAVIDAETTSPIVGAHIYDSILDSPPGRSDVVIATTDAAGHFTVHVVDGSHQAMSVVADGYCAFVWYWEAQEATFRPTIPMRRPSILEGKVQDTAGNNLSSVDMSVERRKHPLSKEDRRRLELPGSAGYRVLSTGYCVTGDDGGFRWRVVPSEQPMVVQATRNGYVVYKAPVTVSSQSPVWLDVVLHQAASIRGRVTYNDRPWRGNVVWKSARSYDQGRSYTDDEGNYSLPWTPPGAVEISLSDNLAWYPSTTLQVVAGREHEHDIDVRETVSPISGVVTNQAGEPIENVGVSAHSSEPGHPRRHFHTRTQADGTYALQVARSRIYTISAFLRGYAEILIATHGVTAGSEGVDLVLRTNGLVRLQFRDASTGEPIQTGIWSADFYWRDNPDGAFQRFPEEFGYPDAEDAWPAVLPTGTLDLSLDFAQSGYAPRLLSHVEVTDDPDPTPYTVDLSPGFQLELRLRDSEPIQDESGGGPVLFLLSESQGGDVQGPFEPGSSQANDQPSGVPMWLADPALRSRRLEFDDEQRAVIRGLAPGRYRIHAFPPVVAFEPDTFQVSESNSTAEVRWRPAASGGR